MELGAPEPSSNRWLALLKQNKSLGCKKGSGRVTKKVTSKVVRQIKTSLNNRSCFSKKDRFEVQYESIIHFEDSKKIV